MEISLYLRTLRKGWWIIALTMLLATNASLLISYLTAPTYKSVSRFVVSPNAGIYDSSWAIVSSLDTLDRRSIINTYKELLVSRSVYEANPIIQEIGPEKVEKVYKTSVVVLPNTNILELGVEGPDPAKAASIAGAIGEEAVVYMNRLYPVYNISVLDKPTIPTTPIRPQTVQNAGLALLFGTLIGSILAFLREQMQETIEKLRERSNRDEISSAYTHVYFERYLMEEITQHPDSRFSLGIVNLRGLDEMSSILPKPLMDRLINTIANKLRSELRGRDIIARWSNTEFAVLLPLVTGSAVDATFKRLQAYLAEPIFLDASGDMIVKPDPCVGVVVRDQLESGEELIKRAEDAVEKATAFPDAAVFLLSRPFVFAETH